jgi:uroporphyrinogen decarboxylase
VVVSPAYVGPPRPEGANHFGVIYKKVDYGSGAYDEALFHPLAQFQSVADLEAKYVWPQADWYDYRCLASQLVGKEEYPVEGP